MSDAIFLSDFTENVEIEAKLAQGRDGQGALPKSFWDTYSAFANTHGGTVFLGVGEREGDFFADGIARPDKVEETLWSLLNDRTKVSHNLLGTEHVQTHKLQSDRSILIITVPRASRQQRPVYIGSSPMEGSYKRRRSGDYRCGREEVERMLAERIEDSRDQRALEHYGLEDLNLETLTAYRQRLANLKPDHPYNDLGNEAFLLRTKGMIHNRETGKSSLSLAGLLMFGQGHVITENCPHYFLDYRELPVSGSKTEWVDRLTADGTWSGNLYDFYRMVITRLFRDLKLPLAFQKDERDDDTPLHKALREALVNTLIHADYSERSSIMVVKAPDYFGFRNPGHMRISIEDALLGGKSDSRNRGLQLMFSLVGLGEQAGSGIPRIVKRWDELAYRQPELWESDQPDSTLMRLRMTSLLPHEAVEALQGAYGATYDALTKNEQLALVTAFVEGFVTNQRLQQVTRLHSVDITALLKSIVDKGLLLSAGAGRATTYTLYGFETVDLAEPYLTSNELSINVATSAANVATSDANVATSLEELVKQRADELPITSIIDIPAQDSSTALTYEQWAQLWERTRAERERGGRMKPETRRAFILELCVNKFINKQELALLFGMSPKGLKDRFLTPLYKEGLLGHRYPHTPNHEQQAYRSTPKS
ncbi:MAG TPA: hypothetical protein DEA90_13590 [Opitutae bacterium]|nr:hypothetical protein [Puniceicoccaceae bacterium]HBR95188.1 hypothetical protein [Opitutae bacterium]|tara:strand:- start:4412 stop:6370 length:1959 start_codon:yes stop_codon:yes gene_type:complete